MKLTNYWNTSFPDQAPIAYKLKNNLSERWVRFHSLPDSKRYAENESEYNEILTRHNKILNELGAENHYVYIVAPEYSDKKEPEPLSEKLKSIIGNASYWQTVAIHDPEDDEEYHSYMHLYELQVKYTNGTFDKTFRLVANDELANIMIICPELNWVFHPYDGGSDIVLANEIEKQKLKNKFKNWLSSHPEGL